MSVKICLAALLCVLAGVAFADEFKHSGVADLSSDFAETTADGKLYFVKVSRSEVRDAAVDAMRPGLRARVAHAAAPAPAC